jgi:hypothetical protein
MTLIRGNQGLYPCPVCLIPWDQLSDLSVHHPLRTAEQTQGLLMEADELGRDEAEDLLKDYGLRHLKVISLQLLARFLLTVPRTRCGLLTIQIHTKPHPGTICTPTRVACGMITCGRRSKVI